MCACMPVCMYVCLYVCTYVRMYVMYVCLSTYVLCHVEALGLVNATLDPRQPYRHAVGNSIVSSIMVPYF